HRGGPAHEAPRVTLTRKAIELTEKVFFVPGQSRVRAESFEVLNWVAKVIDEHPELPLIVVGAHVDDRVPNAQRLTQARAEEVRAYLIQRGIAPERLQAKGYGSERPIASNATSIGRETNRRIEFTIVTLR